MGDSWRLSMNSNGWLSPYNHPFKRYIFLIKRCIWYSFFHIHGPILYLLTVNNAQKIYLRGICDQFLPVITLISFQAALCGSIWLSTHSFTTVWYLGLVLWECVLLLVLLLKDASCLTLLCCFKVFISSLALTSCGSSFSASHFLLMISLSYFIAVSYYLI